MNIINVILSGGVGSRLWPLSRKSKPKQYLPIFKNKSLFELVIERNLVISNQFCIVGGVDNYSLSRKIFKKKSISDYTEIIEACPRNTAAAIAFAALSVSESDILLVTPADHLIDNQVEYKKSIQNAVELAEKGFLVTLGIEPSKPETGYGYIEFEGQDVLSFTEKPDKEKAVSFLQSGNFLWNSGIFCFKAGVYLDELKKHSEEIFLTSERAFSKINSNFLNEILSLEIPSLSIDYAVMEKSSKVKVVPSKFDWSDMGSFDAIYDYIPEYDSRKILTNLALGTKKHIEFIGLQNVILVETRDAILVLNKDNAQDVKKVYERLEVESPAFLR